MAKRPRPSLYAAAWSSVVQSMMQDPSEFRVGARNEKEAIGMRADFYRWRQRLNRAETREFYDMAFGLKVGIEGSELVFNETKMSEQAIFAALARRPQGQSQKHVPEAQVEEPQQLPVVRKLEDFEAAGELEPNYGAYDEVSDMFKQDK